MNNTITYHQGIDSLNMFNSQIKQFNNEYRIVKESINNFNEVMYNNFIRDQIHLLNSRVPVEIDEFSMYYSFNKNELQRNLRYIIEDIHNFNNWDYGTVALAICAYISMSLFGGVSVEMTTDIEEPILNYSIFIGDPAVKKSTTNTSLKKPLVDFQEMLQCKFAEQGGIKAIKQKLKFINGVENLAISELIHQCVDEDGTINFKMLNLNLKIVEQNSKLTDIDNQYHLPDIFLDKFTDQAPFSKMLKNGGILNLTQDEGDHIINKLGSSKYDTKIFMDGYSLTDIEIDRYNKSFKIKKPAINMALYCHPKAALKFYHNSNGLDNGLLSRFLPAWIKIINTNQNEYELSKSLVYCDFNQKIKELCDICYGKKINGEHMTLHLSLEAKIKYDELEYKFKKQQDNADSPNTISFRNRFKAHVYRLAGIIHMYLHYPEKEISSNTVKDAFMIAEFAYNNLCFLVNDYGLKDILNAKKILKCINEHPMHIYPLNFISRYSPVKKNVDIIKALHILQIFNHVVTYPDKRNQYLIYKHGISYVPPVCSLPLF